MNTHDTLPETPAAPDLDSLIGNADEFPALRHYAFFNHAGVSPLPRRAADALRAYAATAQTTSYISSGWYRQIEQLRTSAARMINAHPDEIALVRNTSEGIATVAYGLDWQPGQRIISAAVEYPANVYPWMDLARRYGVELVMVGEESAPDGSRSVPLQKLLDQAARPNTRMVAISHVEFASGQRHDLTVLGQFCRSRGILLCVDAIQTLGVLPVDVQSMNIDFLSADGHKWLLGPEGAGVFYCRRELLPSLRPLIMGWMNVINAERYGDYDFTLKPTAAKFEAGTHNVPGMLSLKASLEMLLALGPQAVGTRLKHLGDRLITGLGPKGYQIISPRADDAWSGIVSFTSPAHNQEALFRSLRHEYHIEIALREGRLRASPHFYNTQTQIDSLLAALPTN